MNMPLRLRRRNDLVCQQVVELVTDYLEETMSRSERRRFDAHLRACPNCSAYLRQMQATIRAMGRLSSEDIAPAALDELTEMFRHWRTEGTEPLEGPER
jgi:anti-sigma factor RsiW